MCTITKSQHTRGELYFFSDYVPFSFSIGHAVGFTKFTQQRYTWYCSYNFEFLYDNILKVLVIWLTLDIKVLTLHTIWHCSVSIMMFNFVHQLQVLFKLSKYQISLKYNYFYKTLSIWKYISFKVPSMWVAISGK